VRSVHGHLNEFADDAPQIAEVFTRRHNTTGNLCLLATLRSDGYPGSAPSIPGSRGTVDAITIWKPGEGEREVRKI